jgi:hypothetical protein
MAGGRDIGALTPAERTAIRAVREARRQAMAAPTKSAAKPVAKVAPAHHEPAHPALSAKAPK